jgi:hypothetical protein
VPRKADAARFIPTPRSIRWDEVVTDKLPSLSVRSFQGAITLLRFACGLGFRHCGPSDSGSFTGCSLGPQPRQVVTRSAFRLFIFDHGLGPIELFLHSPKFYFFRSFGHVLLDIVKLRVFVAAVSYPTHSMQH